MQTASKKVINGWAMYDWANSVYNLVITTTFFLLIREMTTGDMHLLTDKVTFLGRIFVNTALYNYALAFAFFIVAFTLPLLSSIADYKGNKKNFMAFFCNYWGSFACAGLFFFTKENLGFGILLYDTCLHLGFWQALFFIILICPKLPHRKTGTG